MTKIVFFGTEHESALVLDKLIEAQFNIDTVITKPDSERGRGQKIDSPVLKKLADKHNIPTLQPSKLSEITEQVTNDSIGILVSYGKIIPQEIIGLFSHGIINIHPSLLPQYRGPSPIETAIVNGDKTTGVSLMQLSSQMDAGPVYAQKEVALHGNETASELYEKLFTLGASLLINNFDSIVSGKLQSKAQDDSAATYCHLLKKTDGDLNPDTMTAAECERKIRAFINYPKSRLKFVGVETIITKAKVLEDFQGNDWPDVIKCADDTALQIIEIVSPKSGKKMKVADYLNGLQN